MNLDMSGLSQEGIRVAVECSLVDNFRLRARLASSEATNEATNDALKATNDALQRELQEALEKISSETEAVVTLRRALSEAREKVTDYAMKGYLPEQLKDQADRNALLNEVADPTLPFWDNPTGLRKRVLDVFEGLTCDYVSKDALAKRIKALMRALEKLKQVPKSENQT